MADESRPAVDPATAGERSARSLKVPTLAVLVAGAAVALLAATQVWVQGRLAIEGFPGVGVEPTGRTLAPLVPAIGLLALGGALALLLVGRVGRALIGGLVAVLSLVAIVASAQVRADAAQAVSGTLAEAGGVTSIPGGTDSIAATATVWPLVAIVGLVLITGAAIVAASVPATRWPRGGRRYAAPGTDARPAGDAASASDAGGVGMWDALDRGDDPTL